MKHKRVRVYIEKIAHGCLRMLTEECYVIYPDPLNDVIFCLHREGGSLKKLLKLYLSNEASHSFSNRRHHWLRSSGLDHYVSGLFFGD